MHMHFVTTFSANDGEQISFFCVPSFQCIKLENVNLDRLLLNEHIQNKLSLRTPVVGVPSG